MELWQFENLAYFFLPGDLVPWPTSLSMLLTGTADPFHMWTNFGNYMSKRSRVMLDKTDRLTDRRTNRQTNILAKKCWQVTMKDFVIILKIYFTTTTAFTGEELNLTPFCAQISPSIYHRYQTTCTPYTRSCSQRVPNVLANVSEVRIFLHQFYIQIKELLVSDNCPIWLKLYKGIPWCKLTSVSKNTSHHQAIFWTNSGVSSIGPLGINLSEIAIIIEHFCNQ